MKNKNILPTLAATLIAAFFSPEIDALDTKLCRVTDTYGDYLKADCGEGEKAYHIAFINFPIEGQPFYLKSQKFLGGFRNRMVTLEFHPKVNNRTPVVMYLKGKNINLAFLSSGAAYLGKNYLRLKGYSNAQSYAKKHKKGVWADLKQIHPADYMDMEIGKKQIGSITQGKEDLKNLYKTVFIADKRTKVAYPSICNETLTIPNLYKKIFTTKKSLDFKGYRVSTQCTQ